MNEFNINTDQKLDHSQALSYLASRLKEVLNPTIEYFNPVTNYVILKTDIGFTGHDDYDIGFSIKGFSESEGIILFSGYFTQSEPNYQGINYGKAAISGITQTIEDSKLVIVLEGENIQEILAEVFIYDKENDNKNHCTSIESLSDEDAESYQFYEISGDSDLNFKAIVMKDSSGTRFTIDKNSNGTIDQIYKSEQAEKLASPITITINNNDSTKSIYGQGILGEVVEGQEVDWTSVNINATVNVESDQFGVATPTTIGGIKIFDDNEILEEGLYPLKLGATGTEDEAKAYIDGSKIKEDVLKEIPIDIHRYTSMDDATEQSSLGTIVQYIGSTTNNYVNGYFYKKIYSSFNHEFESDGTVWNYCNLIYGPDTLKASINKYNKDVNYELQSGTIRITLKLAVSTINNDTVFIFSNINKFDTTIIETEYTHEELQDNFGIKILDQYLEYNSEFNYDLTIPIEYDTSVQMWVLKNVLPVYSTNPVLTYKGPATWAELEEITRYAEPGDMYTITNKSNQEYFFVGGDSLNWEDKWEFMGDVFTVDGSLNIKIKNDQTTTDVASFTANQGAATNLVIEASDNITLEKDSTSGNLKISATDTSVTSVDTHYTPLADNTSELTASISGTAGNYAKDTEYTVLTGIKAQRDAKGHVTGLTYTALKIKDTNTTYTFRQQANSNTLEVSSGGDYSGIYTPTLTKGDTGTTFTPSVDAQGNLSWTNDGNKTNPQTVNIKGDTGPGLDFQWGTGTNANKLGVKKEGSSDAYTYSASLKGNPGTNGTNGSNGADGKSLEFVWGTGNNANKLGVRKEGDSTYTYSASLKGSNGTNGTNGSDGVSCTHSWNGTTLSITSASGTSSADLKGAPGTNGTNGTNGTSAYWFSGPAVTGTGSSISATVNGSKAGDMYLNTDTSSTSVYNVYKATAANTWAYICNIKGAAGQNATTTSVFSLSANGLAPAASLTNKDSNKVGYTDYVLCADRKYHQIGITSNASKKVSYNVDGQGNIYSITYDSEKYHTFIVPYGEYPPSGIINIRIQDNNNSIKSEGVREIIMRVVNKRDSNITLKVETYPNSSSLSTVIFCLLNMYDVNLTNGTGLIIPANTTVELVFTFWTSRDISFNGGALVSGLNINAI